MYQPSGYIHEFIDYKLSRSFTHLETIVMALLSPFHLAFPVHDLGAARCFYGGLLGCEEGRSAEHWVDFNLYGHQIVTHYKADMQASVMHNPVDGKDVPVPHFGVVLRWEEWETLAQRLKTAEVAFVLEPGIRFQGEVGEQATMFFLDPSGNALEFKAFREMDQLFAK